MPYLPLKFSNLVGHHCSSSALRSVLAYDGIEVSEALAFGLGSGLGFFYSVEPNGSPTRRFNGRAPDLEGNFYRLLGVPLEWARSWQPELLERALEQGRPVLAQTDIYPIPYYDDAHFIGHGLVVVGLEQGEVQGEVIVADIAAQGFSRMPLERFKQAVAVCHPPLLKPYGYAQTPKLTRFEVADVAALAPRAIAETVSYMLEPPTPFEGVAGIRALAADLPNWVGLPDLPWAARFGYQATEKRGTGGGGFRALYRDFLLEVAPLVVLGPAAPEGFSQSAQLWTALADTLKAVAFAPPSAQLTELTRASAVAEEIAELEDALFKELRRVCA